MYPDSYAYTYIDGSDDLALQDARRVLGRQCVLAVDTETIGLDPRAHTLVCVQIATPDDCWIFDVRTPAVVGVVRDLLAAADCWLLQGAPFDCGFLSAQLGVQPPRRIYDTRYAAKMQRDLYPLGTGLDDVAWHILGVRLDKALRTTFTADAVLSEEQQCYAALDALILWPIWLHQLAQHDGRLQAQYAYVDAMCAYAAGRLSAPPDWR